ncbi:hypothetical protein [Chitinibacter sp. GC72]|uniref:hypothetical protein n=1 Tax=Chitinibacter sp. GC72 TaxID=1526917 RepID=UPI0012F848D8|nr:hypothetical protein [Chitinibacter sp. GC72]
MLQDEIRALLEEEERNTVSDAFGGRKTGDQKKSYSVARIRDALLAKTFEQNSPDVEAALATLQASLPKKVFKLVLGNLIRFSFLIELTNLKIGSTKMKTRWLPGDILMPQAGSFEPVRGRFQPGNDPRSSSFEECLSVFTHCLKEVAEKYNENSSVTDKILNLDASSSVPYEFFFDYTNPQANPVHTRENVSWVLNHDVVWLLKARPLIKDLLEKKLLDKIQTKTYKTDRALTGKDKTNRAKRWEVLAGDFQHSTLTECWSVERKLYEDLVCFKNFPVATRNNFELAGLIEIGRPVSRCPVTHEVLDYEILSGDPVHGKAEYQVGHKHPLKRAGRHRGDNVCWQSADGNRIQGDLTIEETNLLLDGIFQRKMTLFPST